ncbi:MAG: dethiobiotin synthase [Pseudomonadota bacterium]
MSAYFVTGSGTEIGKTYVSAAILKAARAAGRAVSASKPLMSGFTRSAIAESDAGLLLDACGEASTEANLARICLHNFEEPAAPNIAARNAGVALDDDALIRFVSRSAPSSDGLHLVEGAGGVMSPATDSLLQRDLAAALGAPAILVTINYLGAISHTLSAMEALDKVSVKTALVVVSQPTADVAPPGDIIPELAMWRGEPILAAPFGIDPLSLGGDILKILGE